VCLACSHPLDFLYLCLRVFVFVKNSVKEISTLGPNIITAKASESVESCMEKMITKGIRHLPIVDDSKKVVGMISIKDLVKTVIQSKEETIKVLSNFALGKGGFYGSE
jgi:predicted transcriptional regulator